MNKESKLKTYYPLLLIVGYILTTTILVEINTDDPSFMHWMHHFMAAFFLVFSFFKLLDLKGFVSAFRGYDLIARRSEAYAYAYPFIELLLGLGFLIHWNLYFLNLMTAIVMGISSLGVIQSLLNKNKIQCACLGTLINLPMSTITLVEDLVMFGMALGFLISN